MRGEQLKFFNESNDSNSKLKRKLIVIPLDTFVLSSVVILLLFILAFSLGVEKGRKIIIASDEVASLPEKELRQENINIITQNKTISGKEQKIAVSQLPKRTETRQAIPAVNMPQAVDKKTEATQAPASAKEGYYIQIASYNKENFALDEAKKLKNKGFPAYTAKKGSFVVLYVGTFKTITEAQKNVGLLKKNYKDCVLRRL
ncbi:MAG: SPOR domain-containing protein [Candidatus Omnitrophica bacterium]|nr:SPOR domain-containing protein [Candidatus Omnitrophota bacterium]